MNYGRIVEDSFKFSWRHKSLWLFGLFAGGGSGFNFDLGLDQKTNPESMPFTSVDEAWQILAPILAAVMVLALIFFIVQNIFSPALVDGINRIARGGSYSFSESYSRGIDFFWRRLTLTVIIIAAFIGLMALSILSFFALSFFALLIIIPVFFAGIFFAITIHSLAERALVVRDTSVGAALEEAYVLMKKHFSQCILIALIFIGLGIGISFVLLMITALLYFPINMVVKAMTENRSFILVLGVILGLPISFVVGGYVGTFFHSLYTLFYFGIVDPESPYAKPSVPVPAAPISQ